MIGIEFFLKKKGIIMTNDNSNSGSNQTVDPMTMMVLMMQKMEAQQAQIATLMAQKASVVVDEDTAEKKRARALFKEAGFVTEVKGAGTRYQKVVQTASLSVDQLAELVKSVPGFKGAVTSIYVTLKQDFSPE